jgi:hypothetical protein
MQWYCVPIPVVLTSNSVTQTGPTWPGHASSQASSGNTHRPNGSGVTERCEVRVVRSSVSFRALTALEIADY